MDAHWIGMVQRRQHHGMASWYRLAWYGMSWHDMAHQQTPPTIQLACVRLWL